MAPVYLNQINAICRNIEQRFEALVLEYGYVSIITRFQNVFINLDKMIKNQTLNNVFRV
jgi:hypothetical protein